FVLVLCFDHFPSSLPPTSRHIIDWETAAFRPLWAGVLGVGWFKEDDQRFIIGSNGPGEFKDDTAPEDIQLRAFFRHHLQKKNPDLFSCFVGGAELRAVLHAAVDSPRPVGETDIFLNRYHKLGYWKEGHRGAFPWDMEAWQHRRMDLDVVEMKRVAGQGDFETLWAELWKSST
ncbi:hypothetical protein F5890DRAFT_1478197, partial [Lentinula detonsa]